jgi:hypothetical protein
MPTVGKKKFAYTKKGKAEAKKFQAKKNQSTKDKMAKGFKSLLGM